MNEQNQKFIHHVIAKLDEGVDNLDDELVCLLHAARWQALSAARHTAGPAVA